MHAHKLFLITIAATACNAAAIMRARAPIAAAIAQDEVVDKGIEQRSEDAFYVPSTQKEYTVTGDNVKEITKERIERRGEDAFYVPSTQKEYTVTGDNVKEITKERIERRAKDAFYVPSTQKEYTVTGDNVKEIAE